MAKKRQVKSVDAGKLSVKDFITIFMEHYNASMTLEDFVEASGHNQTYIKTKLNYYRKKKGIKLPLLEGELNNHRNKINTAECNALIASLKKRNHRKSTVKN